jgi:hypothetical protein
MPESSAESPPYLLDDAWTAAPIPLDGPIERAAASPRGMAVRSLVAGLFGLLAAFIAFQLFISPAATVVLLLLEGVDLGALSGADALTELLKTNVQELIIGNSVGQVLGLAAIALLLTRLHTTALGRYLRLRRPEGALIGLALVGLVALTPIVQWLGAVNQSIPMPDWVQAMEQSQMELIEQVLGGGLGLTFNLVMLAVVPGICEELLFRGYAQRQFERGVGIAGGIALSGLIFGLYHLRLSQALPLSVLGIYLAYLAWRTGSLWPAVIVHFANNAFAIFTANYAAQRPELDAQALETMQVPWYILIPSIVAFAGVMYGLHRFARRVRERRARSDPST